MKLKENRSFWVVFLLSIITAGIYGLYFTYTIARDVNVACEKDGKHTIGLLGLILFSLITLGIFGLVWYIILANRLEQFALANKEQPDVTVLSWILWNFLGAFLFGIGPLVAYYKIISGTNQVCAIYNRKTA